MKNKTIVTLFSGGGGFDIGAMMAGYQPVAAYEYIPEIAEAYTHNIGDHVNVMSVLDIDPHSIPDCMLLHVSPPCPNFSNAKKGAEETENDLSLSRKICDVVAAKRPLYLTLENVYGYRKSKSFKMICDKLTDLGYAFDFWNLNAADYGVPQTRKRLILIARRDGKKPKRPAPTHQKSDEKQTGKGKGTMMLPIFSLKKWIGWYEAIEDLIPTLEPSKFAPWQLKKMPDWFSFNEGVLEGQATAGDRGVGLKKEDQPSGVLMTGKGGRVMRAFVANGSPNNYGESMTVIDGEDPIFTCTSTMYKRPLRAFIMNAANPNGNEKRKFREGDEPSKTITSGDSTGIKGFIPHTQANSNTPGVYDNTPSYTIRASKSPDKAFIISGGNSNSAQPRPPESPSQTIGDVSRVGNIPRAFVMTTQGDVKPIPDFLPIETLRSSNTHTRNASIGGRVVKLSIRALARLQSFPDWYTFPTKEKRVECVLNGQKMYRYITEIHKTLSCTIIGNSVPPLLAKAICETLE